MKRKYLWYFYINIKMIMIFTSLRKIFFAHLFYNNLSEEFSWTTLSFTFIICTLNRAMTVLNEDMINSFVLLAWDLTLAKMGYINDMRVYLSFINLYCIKLIKPNLWHYSLIWFKVLCLKMKTYFNNITLKKVNDKKILRY
jgi:hypothetical protein